MRGNKICKYITSKAFTVYVEINESMFQVKVEIYLKNKFH